MTNHYDDRKEMLRPTEKPDADIERRKVLTAGGLGLAGASLAMMGGAGIQGAVAATAGQFTGKVVLITGATSGIGAATAREFGRAGARVMFCGRRENLGAQVAADIKAAGGDATYMRADVREEDQVRDFVTACAAKFGRIDIAFNNAGIGGPAGSYGDVAMDGEDGYVDLMRTNVDGVFYAMRHELPIMLQQGSGVIMNTASMLGSKGAPGIGVYCASKHAVIGLTQSAARQHARQGLRIFTISPGPIDTPLLRKRGGAANVAALGRVNPSGRVGRPEEVASLVVKLAGDDVAFLTGEDVKIDGADSA